MFKRINREKILNILLKSGAFVILFCFLVAFLPNIIGSIPKLNFIVNNQFAKLVFRSLGALVFSVYSILLFVLDKLYKRYFKRRYYVFFGVLLILICLNALIRFGQQFSFSYIEPYYYHKIVVTYNFGLIDIFSYFFNGIYSLLFTFSLLFVLRIELKKIKHINIIFYSFVGIMVVLVFYSVIAEKNLYINFFRGNDTLQIKSLFPSKNSFSLFLFQASAISIYLSLQKPKFIRIILLIVSFVFALEIVFSGSKIAALALLVFVSSLAFFGSFKVYKNHKIIGTILFLIPVLIIIFILLFLYSPDFRGSGLLRVLYNRFIGVETDSRLTIFSSYFDNVDFKGVIFGYSYQVKTFISMCSSSSTVFVNVDDFHNAFLQIIATYGVIIFACSVLLYVLYSYMIFKCKSKSLNKQLIISMFLSIFLYSMFEDVQLFVSGSANGFLITLLVVLTISEYYSPKNKELVVTVNV